MSKGRNVSTMWQCKKFNSIVSTMALFIGLSYYLINLFSTMIENIVVCYNMTWLYDFQIVFNQIQLNVLIVCVKRLFAHNTFKFFIQLDE